MDALAIFSNPEAWISLLTLTFMEIILGIDNVIFISIVAGKLPKQDQKRARFIGLLLALVVRVILLMFIKWIIGLTEPLFTFLDQDISWRDIILIAGGLFLIYKSTVEIHHKLTKDDHLDQNKAVKGFWSVVFQILILDVVFSFDSIITAVGLAREVIIMIIAVIIAVLVMFAFANPISRFIDKYPTLKILALSFLVMIGMTLILEGMGTEVHKGYIYFAIAFSCGVEVLNIKLGRKEKLKTIKQARLRK